MEQDEKRYAVVATESNIYKCDITDPGSKYLNTFLAIRNKRTNEVKLVQCQEGLFNAVQYENENSIYQNNIVDAKKILNKEFGGKRALSNYERVRKTVLNIDILESTIDKQLDSVESEKFLETDLFDKSQEDRERFARSIFPNLSSGKTVREVFNTNALIGEDMMSHLSDISIEVLNMEPKQLPFVNSYLKSQVLAIQTTKKPDSQENLARVAVFIYIDALIRLINTKSKKLEKAELSKMSAQLENEIRKKFTIQDQTQFKNTKFTRQKSIIYYLILLLLSTENLKIHINFVMDEVDVSRTELLKYAAIIGAKLKNREFLHITMPKLDKDSNQLIAPPPSKKFRGQF